MKKRVKPKQWVICYDGVERHPMETKGKAEAMILAIKSLPAYRNIKLTIKRVQS